MADELYDIRNCLIVGNFHQAIAEGSSVRTVKKKPEEIAIFNLDRESLIARAQLALGQYDAVISELFVKNSSNLGNLSVSSNTPLLLVAICRLAELQKEISQFSFDNCSTPIKIEPLKEISSNLDDNAFFQQQQHRNLIGDVIVVICTGFILARDIPSAMSLASKWIHNGKLDVNTHSRQIIELRGIMADCYLRINRPDLAEKEVAQMKQIDDENSLAIFLGGIVLLRFSYVKSDKVNDALAAFQEINSRCGHSVSVLNLMALCNITRGSVKEAEKNLLDAMSKKSGDPDTIANMASVAALLGKPPEAVSKYTQTATSTLPLSTWASSYKAMEQRFRDACKN